MPFGLKNAGAEYQQMVNKVFKNELGGIIEAYIDDMVVKSCTGKEHVQHLNMIFQKMRDVGMRLNPKKSFFCLSSGKFLGYIVSERGIEVHPSKCRAIIDMEAPKTVKEVQELTGRIAALNRFIARSGEVCKPFFQTIKKTKKFEWTSQCQEAFEQIKTYISNPPIINRPTKGETLYLYVSASAVAVSAALIREEDVVQKLVYFVSKILRDAEERYSTVEKGAFAVLIAARKLRPYFQAHPIKVISDLPLRKALGNLDVSGRLLKWAVELSELLKKGYRKPWLVCVGESQGRKLIDEVHGGICGSHQNPYTVDKRIEREGYFWPTMRKDMIDVVRRCERCQYHSRVSRRPPASLNTIASPWPFDVWGIDILGPFPTARANLRFLIVAVEYFTKWIEAKPLVLITSPQVADFVKHNIVYRYGIPHTIISDNGRQFTGAPFQDMCEGFGILSLFSSVSHPQTNGLAEVSNRTILEGLKKKVEGSKGAWPDFLDEILWSYNTTPRTATGRSPFAMVYGMEAVTPMEIVQPTLRTIAYEWTKNNEKKLVELEAIYELREEARARMAEYQRKMRKNFDKKVAPKHFQPGDWVLRSVEATEKHIGKLDPAWDGPFIVTRSIEGRAYRLQDLTGRDLPNAWNDVHLRKFYK
ncbi:Pol-polyprotein [Rhynchospora pubera]|uniref:Pol-polyprotein n=1 Tax=Rhynchospora pubera TaxID=906938 RepID=A0AAV8FBD6_9POAL|nr:Pol-polyprotein [Rhynchospora pubera]